MNMEAAVKTLNTIETTGSLRIDIKGIAHDSRQVRPGFLFLACPGRYHNGSEFIQQAVEKGAVAVISENTNGWTPPDTLRILVKDARVALAEISSRFYGFPANALTAVGVTGTNGKTTVSLMIHHILKMAELCPGLIGTIEYQVGERSIPAGRTTPEAPELQAMLRDMVKADCRAVVMEVSSHALVQERVRGIDFDVAVFTNLTRDHLDYHGHEEDYFAAKSLLFQGLGRGRKAATAVINGDDPWGMRLAQMPRTRGDVITYGCRDAGAVRGEIVGMDHEGSRVKVKTPWGVVEALQLKLPGRYNVYNALAAMACCGALGVSTALMAEALEGVDTIPGRLEPIAHDKGFHVFVDYAHTDDALRNVLTMLREMTSGKIILVFGCGGNRDRTKRTRMGMVANQLADYTILTNDNPRREEPLDIIRQILEGFEIGEAHEVELNREGAMARAFDMAREGDTVLIAGKGHENYQEFANTVILFDDRDVARRLLLER